MIVVVTQTPPTVREIVRGIKGEKGDTGPTGPKGDTGDTGPQGPPGEPAAPGQDNAVPTFSNVDFLVFEDSQVLFAEEIALGEDAWIEVRENSILREVR